MICGHNKETTSASSDPNGGVLLSPTSWLFWKAEALYTFGLAR